MRSRTMLTLLAVFFFASFIFWTIRLNQSLVSVQLALFEPIQVELWIVMLAAFGAGAILILLFDLAGSIRRYLRTLRERQQVRVLEEKEEFYLKGLDAMVNGRHRKAISRFDDVLERDPDHVSSLAKKGDCLRFLKQYREAAQVLERAVRIDPDHIVGLYSLSDLYAEVDAVERAKFTLERIIESSPETSIAAHFKLRDLLIQSGRVGEAEPVQRRLIEMLADEDDMDRERAIALDLRFAVGEDELDRGEFEAATASFESVLSESPNFVAAYVRLGEARARVDETEKAIQIWQDGYERTGSIEPLTALQDYFLKLEQPESAIGVWKKAIVLSEDELPLRYGLGKLYFRLFMLDESLKEFQAIEDSGVELASVHVFISRVLESKGDFSGALLRTKILVGDTERVNDEYLCGSCQMKLNQWLSRCPRCGDWDSVSVNLPSPSQREPQPEIRPAPTWSIP